MINVHDILARGKKSSKNNTGSMILWGITHTHTKTAEEYQPPRY